MDIKHYMQQLGLQARQAGREISKADSGHKNLALSKIAEAISASRADLAAENQKDLQAGRQNGLDSASLDRLELNDARIEAMIEGLKQVAALPDPVGEITNLSYRPSGIQVGQMRVPLGVIGIIYESIHSNRAIAACIVKGLAEAGLPQTAVQVVETTDRAAVGELITMKEYVDVIVPRGGKSLIERISAEATIPVIKHLDGICHVYIDGKADLEKAVAIAMNAKTHRYGVCNAMETLLVAESIAPAVLPILAEKYAEKGVELRGCLKTCSLVKNAVRATEADWTTEYLAPILSIKIVADIDEAIAHINQYSSAHTESIVTEDYTLARRFLREVDSSSVMVNASTRFADGFEYGLGAEIGISTDKLHARGPVGLQGLTSLKYVVLGDGHIRQ